MNQTPESMQGGLASASNSGSFVTWPAKRCRVAKNLLLCWLWDLALHDCFDLDKHMIDLVAGLFSSNSTHVTHS